MQAVVLEQLYDVKRTPDSYKKNNTKKAGLTQKKKKAKQNKFCVSSVCDYLSDSLGVKKLPLKN